MKIDDTSVDEERKAFYASPAIRYHERFMATLFLAFIIGMVIIVLSARRAYLFPIPIHLP